MAFVPVPETIEVDMRMRLDGQRIENTLYFHKIGGWATADVPVAYNALLVWWNTHYAVPLSNQLTLKEIAITDLSSPTGFAFEIATPVPNPAGDSGDPPLPNNVALCVSFRTSFRGRSFRGRNYVPGLTHLSVTNNTVIPTTVTAIQDAYNELLTVASSLGANWVVASRYSGGTERPIGIHTNITGATVVDNTIDSQRRRLPGRGL